MIEKKISILYCALCFTLQLISVSVSAENLEIVAVEGSGYTVSEMASVRGAKQLRQRLLAGGGTEIESSLGSVLIVSGQRIRNEAQSHKLHRMLTQTVPKVFAEVDFVLNDFHFPINVQKDDYPWQVFLEKSRRSEMGMLSSERCHAAWMGPPANIFLSVDSFLTDCGVRSRSSGVVVEELHRVMVHEVAHALEFRLMGKGFSRRQRWHSEGFAGWFETLHPTWQHDSLLGVDSENLFEKDWSPVNFAGSREDYARSYAMIATIVENRSRETLFSIYAAMDSKKIPFEKAVEAVLGWDMNRWNQETRDWISQRPYGLGSYSG